MENGSTNTAFPYLPYYSLYPSLRVLYVGIYISQNLITCHFSDHLTILSRSFSKCCLSTSVLTFLNANFSTLLITFSSKFLIYIKNNKGPNTDPCATHSKLIFRLKSLHILQHAVFCQSAILLVSQLCHSRYHGLLV